MYYCSICIAEKEIRLCKNIAKIAFFSLQNFAIWVQNLRGVFVQKNLGTDINLNALSSKDLIHFLSPSLA